MASARSPATASGAKSWRARPTANTITTSAGSSRRARRVQNPGRSSRPVPPANSEVIKKPLRTKKTSTPMIPPCTPRMPPWSARTRATARARTPSSAGMPGRVSSRRGPRAEPVFGVTRRCLPDVFPTKRRVRRPGSASIRAGAEEATPSGGVAARALLCCRFGESPSLPLARPPRVPCPQRAVPRPARQRHLPGRGSTLPR
jgi:hypothetical protein